MGLLQVLRLKFLKVQDFGNFELLPMYRFIVWMENSVDLDPLATSEAS